MSAVPMPSRRRRAAAAARPVAVWGPAQRTQFLIEIVGGVTRLARMLGVSPSQPSRWKDGVETPSPEVAEKLLDLDHVVALAVQAWAPEIVMDWMTTANGFLDGARPADVLMQRGAAEVVDALKATLSGAYA
ncbi:MAG TPA: antitoxin Xre/MbcA/ParS toxin-binding domain-containing protein [Solirubrobacter sp.]|nr:antitoxin Xre/MbcA/ParS toxin-binding domain-containing protein [Solirubrobacter sp.]